MLIDSIVGSDNQERVAPNDLALTQDLQPHVLNPGQQMANIAPLQDSHYNVSEADEHKHDNPPEPISERQHLAIVAARQHLAIVAALPQLEVEAPMVIDPRVAATNEDEVEPNDFALTQDM